MCIYLFVCCCCCFWHCSSVSDIMDASALSYSLMAISGFWALFRQATFSINRLSMRSICICLSLSRVIHCVHCRLPGCQWSMSFNHLVLWPLRTRILTDTSSITTGFYEFYFLTNIYDFKGFSFQQILLLTHHLINIDVRDSYLVDYEELLRSWGHA